MELITFGKELLQTAAEQAASWRAGQMVLRQLDRALWLLEKSARWAVPPPLDDRPQPELVRPLPWVFFLMLLLMLRATRESISLVNLVMGKPPLRAGDVVMYIQGKRRYLRTLKYQGNRVMRARTSAPPGPASAPQTWLSGLRSLLEFTVCFRRAEHYSARGGSSEQILVVKRKRSDEPGPAPGGENTMERLIEKMMVDLNADSDDDSSYTLTNATSVKTDSELESDQDTVFSNDVSASTPQKTAISTPEKHPSSQERESLNTTTEKVNSNTNHPGDQHNANINQTKENSLTESSEVKSEDNIQDTTLKSDESNSTKERNEANVTLKDNSKEDGTTPPRRAIPRSENKKSSMKDVKNNNNDVKSSLGVHNIEGPEQRAGSEEPKSATTQEETQKFIQSEKASKQGKSSQKIANGRAIENSSSKKKGNTRH